jgi:hypothetical protein
MNRIESPLANLANLELRKSGTNHSVGNSLSFS